MTARVTTSLGALLKARSGSIKTGPFGTTLKAAEYSRSGVPVISVGEIGQGTLRINRTTPRVGREVVRRLPEYVLQVGDIVFGRKGAVDRCALVRDGEGGYFLGSDGVRIRLGASIDPGYVTYYLQSRNIRHWLVRNASGTTMPSLNQEILARIPLILPSFAEQLRVSAALDDASKAVSALERLIAKKQAIKQGMMQQLLTGKTRLPGFTEPWDDARLGSVLKRPPRYGINAAAVPLSVDTHNYIRITDIDDFGRFTPQPKVGVRHPRTNEYTLQVGDLVFARTGASVGKSYLYDARDGPLVYAGFLINICPDGRMLDSAFLAFFAQTAQYWDWVARTSARSGQPGINGREYAQMPIRVPGIQEQRAIANILRDLDVEIRSITGRVMKARAIKQGMMQQLLTGRTRLSVPEPG